MKWFKYNASLAAGESLEALDVVLASVDGGGLCVVFVAFLHTFQHLRALRVRHIKRSSSEIRSEEVAEGGHLSCCHSGHPHGQSVHKGVGSWGHENGRIVEAKSLHVRVSEIAG